MHSNKGRFRSLAASVMTGVIAIGCAGCSARPEFPAESFQQISAVTDDAVQFVRSASAASSPDEVRAEVKALGHTVLAALQRIESHHDDLEIRNRFDARAVGDVMACLEANAVLLPDSDVMLLKRDEALRSGDEKRIIMWQHMLTGRSQHAVQCAMLATATLTTLRGEEAIDLVGTMIGPVYADAMARQALSGLALDSLLERHAAANEIVLTRLAPRCARRSRDSAQPAVVTVPCVSYELALRSQPKLASALPAHAPAANAVKMLTRITDSHIRLLDVGSIQLSVVKQAVEDIAGAVKAAQSEIQRHAMEVRIHNRADADVYAQMKACSDSHAVLFENVATIIRRFEELQVPDEAATKARYAAFGMLASNATGCAIHMTTYLGAITDLGAVDELGMHIGEIYAITSATKLLAGLDQSEVLLPPQLKAYETVVNRLASRCDPSRRSLLGGLFGKTDVSCVSYQAAVDALSKLSARSNSSRPRPPNAP